VEEILAIAQQQLERIENLCSQSGLTYVELAPLAMGLGIAVGFSETDYVILSVMAGGNEDQLMITSGVLNDIERDRLRALEAVNRFNRNSSAYPVFLHDADVAWALIMQQTFPLDLMLQAPGFFVSSVRGVPRVVLAYREELAESGELGGRAWSWTEQEHEELLIRSML